MDKLSITQKKVSLFRVRKLFQSSPFDFAGEQTVKHVLIAEGFMLYHNQEVYDLIDLKLELKISLEVSKFRRENRKDRPIEDPLGYFDKFVWPNYHHYNQLNLPDLYSLDGTASMENLLTRIIELLSAHFPKQFRT